MTSEIPFTSDALAEITKLKAENERLAKAVAAQISLPGLAPEWTDATRAEYLRAIKSVERFMAHGGRMADALEAWAVRREWPDADEELRDLIENSRAAIEEHARLARAALEGE